MQLRYIILYVPNVSETMAFYERAFGLKRLFLHEGGDYGEMDTGATKLAFSALDLMRDLGKTPGQPDPKRPVFELALETDDVPAALTRAVGAGATLVQHATQQPWGQTISYVTDLNGYLVEICTPVSG